MKKLNKNFVIGRIVDIDVNGNATVKFSSKGMALIKKASQIYNKKIEIEIDLGHKHDFKPIIRTDKNGIGWKTQQCYCGELLKTPSGAIDFRATCAITLPKINKVKK